MDDYLPLKFLALVFGAIFIKLAVELLAVAELEDLRISATIGEFRKVEKN